MGHTDPELLRRYSLENSEEAFAELVGRHLNLVFSTALRQVRSRELAEEIAQSVFTDLARQASHLAPQTILTAWLYQVSRRTAIDVVRREARRQLREKVAAELQAMNATTADWTAIEPLLDEAMDALDETDRTAVLLRYFENKTFREVGQMLDASEDAARKRLSRALEHLREFLARRGVSIGASALAIAISNNAVQAAPVGLALTVSTAVVAAGTVIQNSLAVTATKALAMTTFHKAVAATVLAAALGTGLYEARQAANARAELQTLRQQQAILGEHSQQLQRERDELLAENSNLKSETKQTELLRLRGEVTRLHGDLKDLPANRVALLKRKLDQMPEKRIPELQFLTDKDWLNAAWDADLDSDDGVRVALRKLRDEATDTLLNQMRQALKAYAAANNDTLPANLSELKPYFQTPVTDEMLQRYKWQPTGKPGLASGWRVKKSVYADNEYDSDQEMWLNGGGGSAFNRIQDAINDAARDFAHNNNFQAPTTPAQIAPYLKRTIDTATIQKYLNQFVLDPSPEEVTIAPVLKAYAIDHNGESPVSPSDLLPYITTPEQQAAFQKMQPTTPARK